VWPHPVPSGRSSPSTTCFRPDKLSTGLAQGTVISVNADGTNLVFTPDGAGDQQDTYSVNTRMWIGLDGALRNDGKPDRLPPAGITPQRLELAFMDVQGSRDQGFGDFQHPAVHSLPGLTGRRTGANAPGRSGCSSGRILPGSEGRRQHSASPTATAYLKFTAPSSGKAWIRPAGSCSLWMPV
jgi:hypothetical protein